MWPFGKSKPAPATARSAPPGLFSTHADFQAVSGRKSRLRLPDFVPPKATHVPPGATMDANGYQDGLKANLFLSSAGLSDLQLQWYASQGFIGYQLCAIIAQHWLVDKACTMPAEDAVRKGYSITSNDGSKINPKILDYLKQADKAHKMQRQMIDFVRFGRIFGIRVALFVVDAGADQAAYDYAPFNIDGIQPNSYKGISQIDPYWITPELTTDGVLEPGSLTFYEPEYWRIGSRVIHKSHFCIFTTGSVPDILKPTYFYGGTSIPQRIYERVYAAERTANEAPMLAMTKRLTVLNTDLAAAMADQVNFENRMQWWTETRDNYGVKINATEDKVEQFDLTLTDLDNVIMTQYQIVAAIAQTPGTKLLGTQPKGFNSTGEFEESSYHEFLESIQNNVLIEFLKRHHELVIMSEVVPKFGIKFFAVDAVWDELDAMTSAEQAGVNLVKAQTGSALIASGVIDAQDERNRLINDQDSGYNGMSAELSPMPDSSADPDGDGGVDPDSKPPAAKATAQVPKIAGS